MADRQTKALKQPFPVRRWRTLAFTRMACGLWSLGVLSGCDELVIGPPTGLADAQSDIPSYLGDLGIGVGPDVPEVWGCTPQSCAVGYHCFDPGTDVTPTCLPDAAFHCAPCASDAMCLGGRCRDVGGEGTFCAIPCAEGSCPAGATCVVDGQGPHCTPVSGSCTCGPAQTGKQEACAGSTGNPAVGECARTRTCGGNAGWSACAVPAPATETCNGVDDDCDGATDEGLSGGACGIGHCAGEWQCGETGLVCDGPAAVTETCNGVDDDCDGSVDNGFVTSGLYVGLEHCGGCGKACPGSVQHGTATCQIISGSATCAAAACDPGYWKASTKDCLPTAVFACSTCQTPADCGGDPCVDGACRPFCTVDAPCLPGFVCEAGPSGVGNCQPKSGTCTCTVANAGVVQACAISNSDGTCTGTQMCNPGQGWTACSAAVPYPEVCNGVDDDCNGTTDDNVGAGAACTVANALGSCPGVLSCASYLGLQCLGQPAAAETCNGQDDDCNGVTDDSWLNPQTQQYDKMNACGACGVLCPPIEPSTVVTCAGDPVPACQVTCQPGWVDMNATLLDGCECYFQSDVDDPDGIDQNCDGIDGYLSNAVFVSKAGSDTNAGTYKSPVASIAKAQAIAVALGRTYVYVAGGVYMGTVDLVPGVQVFGGYSPDWVVHDPVDFQSAIVGVDDGGPSAAVRCEGLGGPEATRLDGFLLIGPDAKVGGSSSFGVWTQACGPAVQITYCQIQAGDGAAGIPGEPGLNGQPGAGGADGAAARDIGHDACIDTDVTAGGAGGTALGSAGGGGAGGSAVCPAFDQDNPTPACPQKPYLQVSQAVELGAAGTGGDAAAAGGLGGQAGADSYIDSNKGVATQCSGGASCNLCLVPVQQRDGADGLDGSAGTSGKAGAGCPPSLGAIVGGVWQPAGGGTGAPGQNGGGGGGGGAAGGVEVHDCANTTAQFTDLGGSGGGGGAGGTGGTGGLGGGGGGGSFAVYLQAIPGGQIPQLLGCSLAVGSGGAGATGGPAGSGGPGGQGGKGGTSGEGAQATFCTSKGGNGGAGGNAGHGGGGGGGCGGPAIHLVTVGADGLSAALAKQLNQFKAGAKGGIGGYGGPSIGAAGGQGSTGLAQNTAEF